MQTGNEIVSPTSGPLIKKIPFQSVFYMFQRIQNWFLKQEMELSKQEMELFLPLPGLQSNFFFVIYSEEHQQPILDFENGVIVKIYKS